MSTKIRPPIKWHGGKHYLAHRIIAHFPSHSTFVEPYGGAASILLNKMPSPVEVYADLDHRLTRLFRVIRDDGAELHRRLSLTPYSEVEFGNLDEPHDGCDEIEQARRFFVQMRLSIGGRGDDFSRTLHRVRRGMADVVSGYLSSIDDVLPVVIERLRTVQIVNRPAIEVIHYWDSPETLFYCDPPYLPETRAIGCHDIYGVEMSEADHRQLTEVLKTCKGKVVVSGYRSALYEELYRGWRCVHFDVANHASGGEKKRRQTECLWLNWKADDATDLANDDIVQVGIETPDSHIAE